LREGLHSQVAHVTPLVLSTYMCMTCNIAYACMQVNLTKRELSEVSANLQGCIRDQRRAQLTKAEVDSLSDTAR
jgi:hypothetical protein